MTELTVEFEDMNLVIARLEEEVKKVVRRQDTLQRTVDLLYADREILEDLVGNVKSLQEILVHSRQHQNTLVKDMKAEVVDQAAKLEQKVDEVQREVGDTITGLVENIKQKKIVVIKEGLFTWFRKFLQRIS